MLPTALFQALLVRDGQFPAALFAAARNKFAAIFGGHALAKAVFVLACAAGWLVCAFHRCSKIRYCVSKMERKGSFVFLKKKNNADIFTCIISIK